MPHHQPNQNSYSLASRGWFNTGPCPGVAGGRWGWGPGRLSLVDGIQGCSKVFRVLFYHYWYTNGWVSISDPMHCKFGAFLKIWPIKYPIVPNWVFFAAIWFGDGSQNHTFRGTDMIKIDSEIYFEYLQAPCLNLVCPQPNVCPISTCTLHVTTYTKCEFLPFWNCIFHHSYFKIIRVMMLQQHSLCGHRNLLQATSHLSKSTPLQHRDSDKVTTNVKYNYDTSQVLVCMLLTDGYFWLWSFVPSN